jgi:RNA polymerase sigma-70 factor (ECF subfamily)
MEGEPKKPRWKYTAARKRKLAARQPAGSAVDMVSSLVSAIPTGRVVWYNHLCKTRNPLPIRNLMTDSKQDNHRSRESSLGTSLLEGLRTQDPEAWRRAVHVYYPLVRKWCQGFGLQPQDTADVAQETFRTLAGAIGRFRREEGKNSFRGWLWGITRKQVANYRRRQKASLIGAGGTEAQKRLAQLPDESEQDASVVRPANERTLVLRRALGLLQAEVEPRTWQAFWRVVVEGQAPAEVAADLGLTTNAIYLLKARLLRRLREEFGELLD